MNKNFFFFLIGSVVLGFLSAHIVYSRYKDNLENAQNNAYLIQIGSYNNEESAFNSLGEDFKYLVIKEDNIFNVYAGITTDLFNANKIKSIYEKMNFDISIKPTVIDNIEFISNLEQYDMLISEVDSDDNVISINDVILSSYEELVLGN